MLVVDSLTSLILLVIQLVAIGGAAYAIFHAARQRPDAFTAVDKLTKPAWLGILIGSLVAAIALSGFMFILIIAIVAVSIYLVDVRPKVDGIQRGPRW